MSHLTILCVDDERNVLLTLRNQLIRYFPDCTIEVAESCDEALALVNELIADGVEIPLVIADQIMPSKKGDQLLIELHQHYPDMLKVMLTGQASAEDVGHVVNCGSLYQFIAKPWSEANLILVVTEALRRYRQERQLAQQQLALERANQKLASLNASLEQQVQERTQQLQTALTSLQQTTAEMQAIFNAFPDFLFRMNAQGTILDYQAGANQHLYVPPEVFLGQRLQDIMPPELQTLFDEAIQRTLTTNEPVSFEYQLSIQAKLEDFEGRFVPFQADQVILIVRKITDRKRLETELQQSQAFLRSIYEGIEVSISVLEVTADGNYRYLDANPATARLAGITPDALRHKTIAELQSFLTPAGYQQVVGRYQHCVTTRQSVQFEEKTIVDGQDFWWLVRVNPLINAAGVVHQLIVSALPVTEIKQAEAALRESEARYRRIVETANEGIWIVDTENKTSFVNTKMAEMLGYSVEAVMGRSLFNFMGKSEKATAAKNIERRRQGIVDQYDFKFQHRNGSEIWAMLSVNPIIDDAGQYLGALAMVTDITTRKQAEQALSDSEEKFRQLAENIHQVFFIHDIASQQVLYVSPPFETIWGMSCDRLYADSTAWLEIIHPEDYPKVLQSISQDLQTPSTLEYRIIQAGQIRWIYSRAFPIRDGEGQIYRIAGIAEDVTERKQIELEMIQSRDLREVIFNESADALFLVDPETSLTIDCNERAVGLFAADSKAALINIQGDRLQRTAFSEPERTQIKAAIAAHGLWSREIEYITLQGTAFWGNLAAKRLHVAGKNLDLVRVTDISDRKRTELALQQLNEELEQRVQQRTQELQQQTQLFQTILNSIGDAILVADTTGEIILHNPAAEAMTELGLPDSNIATWPSVWGVYLPNGLPCPTDQLPLVRAIRGESADRLEVILRKESYSEGIDIEASIRPLLDVTNRVVGGVAVFRDISERKQAEVEIRTSQERLRAALSASGTGTFRWDIPTDRLEWDENLNHLFGLPANQTAHNLSEFIALIYPDDRESVIAAYNRCMQAGLDFEQEFRVVWPDGTIHWLFDQGKVFFDDQHRSLYVAGACVDITERKRAEAALRHLNLELEQRVEKRTLELKAAKETADAANQAKSDFLANMSHELRTPLNGVLGYAQILQRDPSLTPKQQEASNVIYRCGHHLLTLISDILELAKIEARKLDLHNQDFALSPFLAEIIELCQIRAQQKQINFAFMPLTELPLMIHADAKHLRQVLLNLISNGIKFTDRGTVSFIVSALPPQSGAADLHTRLRFQIEDTGIGITTVQLERVFLPFEQVCDQPHQSGGTGLGLAISQQIVCLMGSQIQVESVPGQGSCFWFEVEVPVVAVAPTLVRPKAAIEAIIGYQGPRRRILVVDDAEDNRWVLVNLLQPLGFELSEAESGWAGWNQAMAWHPDLLIIDLRMPGIDGLTLTERLRQRPEFQQTVILISSASVFSADRDRSLAAGANAFIAKPIEIEVLLQQMQDWLQLEWIYDTDTWVHSPQLQANQPIAVPPLSVLQKLYDLAIRGRIKLIEREIEALQTNSQWHVFTAHVAQLAQTCQIEPLRQFLQQLID